MITSLSNLAQAAAWDAYVQAHPEATFFHLAGWREVIGNSFRVPAHYLFAEQAGQVTGVLPLFHVRSLLFGNTLVSVPFFVYGGVLASDEASRAALQEAAGDLARELRVDYVEYRHRRPTLDLPVVDDRYVTFRREISADSDENLKAIPRKQRAMVRKAGRNGLETDFRGDVGTFFDIYARSLRDMGTPALPQRFFRQMQQTFGQDTQILILRKDGVPVSTVFSFYFRDEVLPYYGGGTEAARSLSAFDGMYWELMVHAAERGVRVFDYGRSRIGTGSYRFKKHWGFEPTPMAYQYDLVGSPAVPNKTPDNPRFELAIKVWKKLPLAVTNRVGPWLSRGLW